VQTNPNQSQKSGQKPTFFAELRRDEDENQLQGFPCAARRKGQTQGVADDCEALLQVEEAVSKTPGRTR
jgi:hypothetical protein